jgi:hypothetical protein
MRRLQHRIDGTGRWGAAFVDVMIPELPRQEPFRTEDEGGTSREPIGSRAAIDRCS